MQYSQFEDLPVWQDARKFVNLIYKTVAGHQKLARDFSLVDQLKRCSYSIMLNISEGFERGSNKEFANFINIAKGSAGEARAILYILLDNTYIPKETFASLQAEVLKISSSLSNFRKYLLSRSEYKK